MSDSEDKKLNMEDKALWDAYVHDPESKGKEPEIENFKELLEGVDAPIHNKEAHHLKNVPTEEILIKPALQKVNPPQLDKRTDDKLRKGRLNIDRRLDLHGLTQAQARDRLISFLTESYNNKARCVLVITGKGITNSTSDDWLKPSNGVLKTNVPFWLSQKPCQDIVLKYYPAQPKDGGSGALYVYLKRNR